MSASTGRPATLPSAADCATLIGALPRIGWVRAPTPLHPIGFQGKYVLVKRDDLLASLHGGTKPRKLDYLLASEPYASATHWHSVGATGSGHVVACAAAAKELGKRFTAHCFYEPLSGNVLENLAYTATHATRLRYYGSRTSLVLRSPLLIFGQSLEGAPVIGPGALQPRATLGVVLGALELERQLRERVAQTPDALYVALGTGGTTVGLAIGLLLAGLDVPIRAVAVVEALLTNRRTLRAHARAVAAELAVLGIHVDGEKAVERIEIVTTSLGRGYGYATNESLAATRESRALGLALEPVYTGKAWAALTQDLADGKTQRPLFWCTVHAPGLPAADDWQERLPRALRRRLARAQAPAGPGDWTRRKLVIAGGATLTLVAAGLRFTGYRAVPGFLGQGLFAWEAVVVRAMAELMVPHASADELDAAALHADDYVATLPPDLRRELHGAFALVEHGTALGLHARRFSSLEVGARRALAARLDSLGGLVALAARGVRDVALLGVYAQPAHWQGLGYPVPPMPSRRQRDGRSATAWPAYDALRAPKDAQPKRASHADDAP